MARAVIRLLETPDMPDGFATEIEIEISDLHYGKIKERKADLESVGPFEENGPTYIFRHIEWGEGGEMILVMVSKPH